MVQQCLLGVLDSHQEQNLLPHLPHYWPFFPNAIDVGERQWSLAVQLVDQS